MNNYDSLRFPVRGIGECFMWTQTASVHISTEDSLQRSKDFTDASLGQHNHGRGVSKAMLTVQPTATGMSLACVLRGSRVMNAVRLATLA